MICSYNKSQQDALFLIFILVKKSTRFGKIYCPSSRVLITYVTGGPGSKPDQNNVGEENMQDYV